MEKLGFFQNPASPASDLATGRRGREGVPDADKEGLQLQLVGEQGLVRPSQVVGAGLEPLSLLESGFVMVYLPPCRPQLCPWWSGGHYGGGGVGEDTTLNGLSMVTATRQWEPESDPWANQGQGTTPGDLPSPGTASGWACLCPTHCASLLP